MSAGEKEERQFSPSIRLLCLCQFYFGATVFIYAFSNIWIVGSVSTYPPGVRRNPLYARLYIYTYIIVSDRMSDGAWPDLDMYAYLCVRWACR